MDRLFFGRPLKRRKKAIVHKDVRVNVLIPEHIRALRRYQQRYSQIILENKRLLSLAAGPVTPEPIKLPEKNAYTDLCSIDTMHICELVCELAGDKRILPMVNKVVCSRLDGAMEGFCLISMKPDVRVDHMKDTHHLLTEAQMHYEDMRKSGYSHKNVSSQEFKCQVLRQRLRCVWDRVTQHPLIDDVAIWMSPAAVRHPLSPLLLSPSHFRRLRHGKHASLFMGTWNTLASAFDKRNSTVDKGMHYSCVRHSDSMRIRTTSYTESVSIQAFMRGLCQSILLVSDPLVCIPSEWIPAICVVSVWQQTALIQAEVDEMRRTKLADWLSCVPGIRLCQMHSINQWIIRRIGGPHRLHSVPDVIADLVQLFSNNKDQAHRVDTFNRRPSVHAQDCTIMQGPAMDAFMFQHECPSLCDQEQADWFLFHDLVVPNSLLPMGSDSEEMRNTSWGFIKELCQAQEHLPELTASPSRSSCNMTLSQTTDVPLIIEDDNNDEFSFLEAERDPDSVTTQDHGQITRLKTTEMSNSFLFALRHYPETVCYDKMKQAMENCSTSKLDEWTRERKVWLKAIKMYERIWARSGLDLLSDPVSQTDMEVTPPMLHDLFVTCLRQAREVTHLGPSDTLLCTQAQRTCVESVAALDRELQGRRKVATSVFVRLQFAWDHVKQALGKSRDQRPLEKKELEPMRQMGLKL